MTPSQRAGAHARAEKAFEEAAEALSEEEQKRRHSGYRLQLTEHIEMRLKELTDSLPGFRFETVVEESGWGGAVTRDDFASGRGKRENLFSRLRIVVSSFNEFHVVDLSAKGTVRNKENFSRNHYQAIADFDPDMFKELIDRWVLDYAEQYAGV